MARSRNIKPGFFNNEYLAELDPLARILFEGLWCIADREGRLEDRPKKIKAAVLPYDDCDVDLFLDSLMNSSEQFIIRYSVGDKKYIQITNFHKHQNPHKNEAQSIIPPVPEGFQQQHHTSTVQALEYSNTNPADSLLLNPDSLISDSLIDEEDDDARARGEIYRKFEQEFGRPLTPLESEQIISWYDDHPLEIIAEALKQAVVYGRVNLKYIDSILECWKKNNIRTVREIAEYQEEFNNRKSRGDPKGNPPPKKLIDNETAKQLAELDEKERRKNAAKQSTAEQQRGGTGGNRLSVVGGNTGNRGSPGDAD